jgi:DNA polymerase I
MRTMISSRRELPQREIWIVDTEFYPGRGLANGGRDGDPMTPLCLVARELRSGRVVELWQDKLGPFPPYRLDADACIITYVGGAEFGVHATRSWGQPACAIDAYVEFRHLTNDGNIKSGDREKGFYSLDGALRYFGGNGIDTAHKKDMRDRILQGPPFSLQERRDILDYCRSDADALAQLIPYLVPTIRSLPHAYMRASFVWAIAQQEYRGIPLARADLNRILDRWDDMRVDLVTAMDAPYGCYEIVDGEAHWRKERHAAMVQRLGVAWPTYADGSYDTTAETFKEVARQYPELEPLRELRSSISKLRLHKLAVGGDNRNRAQLWPYSTKTARNAPGASAYVFGPAKWLRFLITPSPGFALVYRDYEQQEMFIAAVVSGDSELLAACETGDVYLGIAKQLGFAPPDATKKTHGGIRNLFKTVCLGILYGLGARSLASRTGISRVEAREILARLRARFRVFEEFAARVADRAGLELELSTPFDWRMRCPPGTNPRTIRNFPIQSSGSEILHTACILAERRKIRLVASVHDALMAEAPVDAIEETSAGLDQVMRDASVVVLKGYELGTDEQVIRWGGRFKDDRGQEMWNTVSRLAKLEEVASA